MARRRDVLFAVNRVAGIPSPLNIPAPGRGPAPCFPPPSPTGPVRNAPVESGGRYEWLCSAPGKARGCWVPGVHDTPAIRPDSSPKPFDEESLREAILSVWGEYGAHMDIYDSLLRRLRECAKIPTLTGDMVKAAREDARWSGYPMPSVVMACALQAALDTLHHSSSDTLTRDFPL